MYRFVMEGVGNGWTDFNSMLSFWEKPNSNSDHTTLATRYKINCKQIIFYEIMNLIIQDKGCAIIATRNGCYFAY